MCQTATVEYLISKVCAKRHLLPSQIRLKIDGEAMDPRRSFDVSISLLQYSHRAIQTYDLEGDELIDATIVNI